MNRLNVILILIDGGRLDRAKESHFYQKLKSDFSFISNSITYGPHTIAAMHATFSGSYGTRTGTNSYWSTFKFKKNKFKTLTDYLHEKNYSTICDIVNKLVIPKQNFDEFLIHDEQTDDLSEKHCRILQKLSENKDKNFFTFFQFSNIHTGIMNEVLRVYDNFSEEYFHNKEKNENRYDELFKKSEIYLTKIFEKINSLGLDKNSIIWIMSDHGISVGEKFGEKAYGAYCYDYTLKTFAFVKWPGMKSEEINQQVRTVDFLPTILDVLDIPLDIAYESLDGESLLPLFNGEHLDEKLAFSETGNPLHDTKPPKEPNTKSVRTSKWKFILNEHNNTTELYDLEFDPDENINLSGTQLKIEDFLARRLEEIKNSK